MKNDNKASISYRIKDTFLDDQVGTTPNENRLMAVGSVAPSGLGLTSFGLSLSAYFYRHADLLVISGFLTAVVFASIVQFYIRRATQMRDKEKRIYLLDKIKIIPLLSILFSVISLATCLIIWFLLPQHAPETSRLFSGISIVWAAIGVLLTPFSFWARRISWLVHPR